jgi:NitT/TauT family transport system ATP-binding protein
MSEIHIENLSKTFREGETEVRALANVFLDVPHNKIVSLVGPSGCGKTTVLNLVAGFMRPTSGRVVVDSREVDGTLSQCGVVFQADSVFPWMTVEQNVSYGLKLNGHSTSDIAKTLNKYVEMVGLTDFANRWPRELSGGMRKRVDLARAYAFNPRILLMDEPFGSLDVLTKEDMQLLLLQIWQRERKTILFITHDVEEALFLGHHVAVMTARPGSISKTFDVPFPMPREASLKFEPAFLDVRRRIVEALKGKQVQS